MPAWTSPPFGAACACSPPCSAGTRGDSHADRPRGRLVQRHCTELALSGGPVLDEGRACPRGVAVPRSTPGCTARRCVQAPRCLRSFTVQGSIMQQLFRRRAFVAALPLALASTGASAQGGYPSRPVKLVVGFPPGGPTDAIGRMIASNLGRELGMPVVIENQGGAGGTIAAANVARSAPDGYTLLVSVEASQTRAKALYPTIRYDQVTGFSFIRKLVMQRNMMVVNPGLPIASVAELTAHAKAHPGQLAFGGTVGATSHIGGTIFNRLNGTDMTFVSYAGGNQPITDLMSGTLQAGFFTESTVAELVRAGQIRALAVTALERSPAFPELPTVEEAGGGKLDISPWFGIVGPAGLPPAVTERLVEASERVARSAEFRVQIETIGASPIRTSDPESFRGEVEREIAFWTVWAAENRAQLQ